MLERGNLTLYIEKMKIDRANKKKSYAVWKKSERGLVLQVCMRFDGEWNYSIRIREMWVHH